MMGATREDCLCFYFTQDIPHLSQLPGSITKWELQLFWEHLSTSEKWMIPFWLTPHH